MKEWVIINGHSRLTLRWMVNAQIRNIPKGVSTRVNSCEHVAHVVDLS